MAKKIREKELKTFGIISFPGERQSAEQPAGNGDAGRVAWGSGPGWGKRAESESDDETASSSSTEEADEPKKPSNPPLSVAEPKRSVEVAQPVQLPEAAAQQDAIPSALGIEWIDNEAKLNACVRSLQKNLFEQFKEKKSLQENRIGVIALRCEGDGRIAPVPVVSVATRTSAYVIRAALTTGVVWLVSHFRGR